MAYKFEVLCAGAIIVIASAWPMRPRGAFVVSFCHFHKIINEWLMDGYTRKTGPTSLALEIVA